MILFLDGIGEIVFRKNARSRNLKITVKPFEGVRVTVPAAVSYKDAATFVVGKTGWIEKSIKKMRAVEDLEKNLIQGEAFHTKYHEVKIMPHEKNVYDGHARNGVFCFYHPANLSFNHPEVQKNFQKGLHWLLRKEAKAYLPFRTMHLAEKHNFAYQGVSVKNQKSRWGSCSYTNNINLNIHLMRLPDHLIDYVILHELVHTQHKNHGKEFWLALDKVTGGHAKALRNEMKKYRIF